MTVSNGKIEAVSEYKDLRLKYDKSLNEAASRRSEELKEKLEMEAAIAEDVSSGYDHAVKLYKIRESIKDVFDDAYTDKQIESAVCHCERCVEGFKKLPDRKMIQAVRKRLEDAGKAKKEKREAAVKANEAELYKGLQGAMA